MYSAKTKATALRREGPPDARPPGPWRRGARRGLGIVAWLFLMGFVLLATFMLCGALFALVILRSPPDGGAATILLAGLIMLAAVMSWVVARFVATRRLVGRAVGGTVAIELFALVWAFSSPDTATYLARTVAWGESDVWDYQKFPERHVENAPPVFRFAQRPSPELFRTVAYTVHGKPKKASFDEFMRFSHTTSFIVIKDDAILYEGYFNGYRRDSIVTSFSCAKSIASALVGIAIDEGYIGAVGDPVIKYLPEMKGRGFDGLTIRDLLLMSTGIRFVPSDDVAILQGSWPYTILNPFADDAAAYEHPDLRKLALGLPAGAEPVGTAFKYNLYHPLILGLILERTTGRSVSRYTQEKIWEPLGMEYPASWSLDSTRHGFEKMESGFNGRAIDFARFGRLFLREGDWNGRRVISRQWVIESTAPDPDDRRPWLTARYWKDAGGYYKYMWWGMPRQGGGYDYMATGHLGQKIAIFPRDRLIIVRFGIDDRGVDSWDQVIWALAATLR